MLAQDLHADGALPGDHVGIVVGMHEHKRAFLLEGQRVLVGIAVRVADQHDLRAARGDCVHLDARRGDRHHDHRLAAQYLRGKRYTLRVVARGCSDHAPLQLRLREARHLVVGAA